MNYTHRQVVCSSRAYANITTRLTEQIEPKKALGQHFLVDRNYCRRIVHFAGISKNDTVLEIGPGTGQLTNELLKTAGYVIVVEFDRQLVPLLRKRWSGPAAKRLQIVEGDILEVSLPRLLPRKGIHLVANLPYNIATLIIKKMTEISDWFQSLTVMVQREVAERILAPCHDRNHGYFSVFVQYHYQLERGFHVPPGAFSPLPGVVSTVLKLTPCVADAGAAGWARLDPIVSRSFRHPRKTLFNNLRSLPIASEQLEEALSACKIDRSRRPHQVSLEEFCCLAQVL